jgi:hypothetical protein
VSPLCTFFQFILLFFFNFAASFSGYLGLLSLMENFSVREVFFLKLA